VVEPLEQRGLVALVEMVENSTPYLVLVVVVVAVELCRKKGNQAPQVVAVAVILVALPESVVKHFQVQLVSQVVTVSMVPDHLVVVVVAVTQ
jgi:uncharacterized membrane protein YoaK (UPF0700 family)